MQRGQTLQGGPAMRSLPAAVQKELDELNVHVATIRWFQPDGKPNLEWKIFYAPTLEEAKRKAIFEAEHSSGNTLWLSGTNGLGNAWNLEYWETHETLLNIARSKGRAEASKEAKDLLQNTVIDIVMRKARLEIWHEIKDKVMPEGTVREKPVALESMINLTAKAITLDVAAAAKLMARSIVLQDLNYLFKETHTNHAKKRMEVWEKGYCLAADINGVLYVYCAAPQPPEQLQLRI